MRTTREAVNRGDRVRFIVLTQPTNQGMYYPQVNASEKRCGGEWWWASELSFLVCLTSVQYSYGTLAGIGVGGLAGN